MRVNTEVIAMLTITQERSRRRQRELVYLEQSDEFFRDLHFSVRRIARDKLAGKMKQ
jgi:hypothetical protein